MKKFLAVLLSVALIISMFAVFSACGKKDEPVTDDETTTAVQDVDEDETTTEAAEDTTADPNMPQAGETVKLGAVSVTIPQGWVVDEYAEGEEIVIMPNGAFLDNVDIVLYNVYGDDHAKEWADNINGNYGGDNEIDSVDIGGKTFYRVKATDDQNICFADIDDSTYVKVSVMYMPWDDAAAVLSAISFS